MHCRECGNPVRATEQRWPVEDWHTCVLMGLGGRNTGGWLCSRCHGQAGRRMEDAYYDQLARYAVAAGVVFHDADRVLLVQPAYRDDTWEIPGGAMDEDDDNPLAAARREVREELGLDLDSAAPLLLAVDWVPSTDDRPALVHFVFDGGPLTQVEAERQIVLPPDELVAWRFTPSDEFDDILMPRLSRRLAAALDALAAGTTVYLHHGRRP